MHSFRARSVLIICIYTYTHTEKIYYKELACAIVKAEKSHNLPPSSSWRRRKPVGKPVGSSVRVQRSESKEPGKREKVDIPAQAIGYEELNSFFLLPPVRASVDR